MNVDLNALKEAAAAATPGPWSQKVDHRGKADARVLNSDGNMLAELDGYCDDYHTEIANAEYIALANPAAVLALIERLERAESALADNQGGV